MNLNNTLLRSILFVPGSEQKHLDKAVGIPADALVFDLEDAVAPSEKLAARGAVVQAITSSKFTGRQLIVRVNGIASGWFEDDMEAISKTNNCSIMLPKCESPQDVLRVKEFSETSGNNIFALIETAMGVLAVKEIANALSEFDALCFGHVDFAADIGLTDADASRGGIHHARCQVALAARAYNLSAIDNVCVDVKNAKQVRHDAQQGMDLGYTGKLCIHPNQVGIVNEVYTPTQEQLVKANAILAAWDEAQAEGQGVFSFENKMVDLPVIQSQQRIVQRYELALKQDGGE
ncbi:MAG: citrate lyase subunit beta [Cycloclasticus sp. symbiont of Poecilosclerida sp. M]|nr:MAG: citrate lyase subunit beta [Cycloclasticus sp. symbiont of Poecilosclerida sp. M]